MQSDHMFGRPLMWSRLKAEMGRSLFIGETEKHRKRSVNMKEILENMKIKK